MTGLKAPHLVPAPVLPAQRGFYYSSRGHVAIMTSLHDAKQALQLACEYAVMALEAEDCEDGAAAHEAYRQVNEDMFRPFLTRLMAVTECLIALDFSCILLQARQALTSITEDMGLSFGSDPSSMDLEPCAQQFVTEVAAGLVATYDLRMQVGGGGQWGSRECA